MACDGAPAILQDHLQTGTGLACGPLPETDFQDQDAPFVINADSMDELNTSSTVPMVRLAGDVIHATPNKRNATTREARDCGYRS